MHIISDEHFTSEKKISLLLRFHFPGIVSKAMTPYPEFCTFLFRLVLREIFLNTVILLSRAQRCWHRAALTFSQALKAGPLQPALSPSPASSSANLLNQVYASTFLFNSQFAKSSTFLGFCSSSSLLPLGYFPSLWPGCHVKLSSPLIWSPWAEMASSFCFCRAIGLHRCTQATKNMRHLSYIKSIIFNLYPFHFVLTWLYQVCGNPFSAKGYWIFITFVGHTKLSP